MKLFKVSQCSCDGGRLGRAWNSKYFISEQLAKKYLTNIIEETNLEESKRIVKIPLKYRQYIQDIHDNCYVQWQYLNCIYLEEVETED